MRKRCLQASAARTAVNHDQVEWPANAIDCMNVLEEGMSFPTLLVGAVVLRV
jgi:hypothetical protein